MKQRTFFDIVRIALCALMILLAVGCATKARDRAAQAEQLYSSTLDVLADARALGKIDDAGYRRIEEWRVVAALALDAMKASAAADDTEGFNAALARFRRALDVLIAEQAKVKPNR